MFTNATTVVVLVPDTTTKTNMFVFVAVSVTCSGTKNVVEVEKCSGSRIFNSR